MLLPPPNAIMPSQSHSFIFCAQALIDCIPGFISTSVNTFTPLILSMSFCPNDVSAKNESVIRHSLFIPYFFIHSSTLSIQSFPKTIFVGIK